MNKLYQKEIDVIWELISKEPQKKDELLGIIQIIETYGLLAENLIIQEKKDIGDFNPTYYAYFNFGFCANDQFRKLSEMKRDFRKRKEEKQ